MRIRFACLFSRFSFDFIKFSQLRIGFAQLKTLDGDWKPSTRSEIIQASGLLRPRFGQYDFPLFLFFCFVYVFLVELSIGFLNKSSPSICQFGVVQKFAQARKYFLPSECFSRLTISPFTLTHLGETVKQTTATFEFLTGTQLKYNFFYFTWVIRPTHLHKNAHTNNCNLQTDIRKMQILKFIHFLSESP